jgi:hypothetical protein
MTTHTYRAPYVPIITEIPYGPDAYYQLCVLSQTALDWLGDIAEGNLGAVGADGRPTPAGIFELSEAHGQWKSCLFDGVATSTFSVDLARNQIARTKFWAGKHPFPAPYVEDLRGLLATLETYEESTFQPGMYVKRETTNRALSVPIVTQVPYGPDVYYQFCDLTQTAIYWLGYVASENPKEIRESNMPSLAEIREFREAHGQWKPCLFDGFTANASNIELAQNQLARAASWAGTHPFRVSYVEKLRDLLATLETYQDSTSNPGISSKSAPTTSAAFALPAPATSST